MRILFVDDELNVLQGLKRSLRSMRKEAKMEFVSSGKEAQQMLVKSHGDYDILVSDIRMPGMDGAQLLTWVKQYFPQIIRFALSGGSETEVTIKTTHVAHQYLSKPCDSEMLRNILKGAITVRNTIGKHPLQKLLSFLSTIPSMPEAYAAVMGELEKPEPSIKEIGTIIARDIGMTAKILQMVNSAFFGVTHKVSKPEQAASLLGLEKIKSLVLTVGIFSQFETELFPEFDLSHLWKHSSHVGSVAQGIAKNMGVDAQIVDDSLLSGLLHDAGKLMLAANLPMRYKKVIEKSCNEQISLRQAENELLTISHSKAGAYVMGIWGLPASVIDALANHHNPCESENKEFSPLTAVHVANALVNQQSAINLGGESEFDLEYLESLNLTDKIPEWQQLSEEILSKEREIS
jgi:HD-like signal output (HDOD) protein/ActR/RegA family two-component response regulator